MVKLLVSCGSCGSNIEIDYSKGRAEVGEHIDSGIGCTKCGGNKPGKYEVLKVLEKEQKNGDEKVKLSFMCNSCGQVFKDNMIPTNIIDEEHYTFSYKECPKCKEKNSKFVILNTILAKCRKCKTSGEIEVMKGVIDFEEQFVFHDCKKCGRETTWDLCKIFKKKARCNTCLTPNDSFIVPLNKFREKKNGGYSYNEFDYECYTCKKVDMIWSTALLLDGQCPKCNKLNKNLLTDASLINEKNKTFGNYCAYCSYNGKFNIFSKDESKEELSKKNVGPVMERFIGCYNCKDSYLIKNLKISDSTKKILYEKNLGFGEDKKIEWFLCPFCNKKTNAVIYEKKLK